MKAVILVGGQGTRLRPLTCNMPKPLLPLVNRPFLLHMIELLRKHGLTDIILSEQYLSEAFEESIGDGADLGVNLTYVRESKPLGTAGAVKNVEKYLDGTFVVFNGDILSAIDLTAMIQFHKEHESSVSIALTPVEDPTAYGLVELNEERRVLRFLEKPRWEDVTTNLINAGTYICEPQVLRYVPPDEHYMFERGLFPVLLQTGDPMHGFASTAYWMDIGTPQKYLESHHDILMGKLPYDFQGKQIADRVWLGENSFVDPTARLLGPIVIGDNCTVETGAAITGPAVLGNGCRIGRNSLIEDALLWQNVAVGSGVILRNCVVANDTTIEENVAVTGGAVVGDSCSIGAGNKLERGIKIWPNVAIQPNAIAF
jgi:mannose-1-phosphate guanylyltransferase